VIGHVPAQQHNIRAGRAGGEVVEGPAQSDGSLIGSADVAIAQVRDDEPGHANQPTETAHRLADCDYPDDLRLHTAAVRIGLDIVTPVIGHAPIDRAVSRERCAPLPWHNRRREGGRWMTETRFLPSTHGLKFPNYWPPGTPDLIAHTLIGTLAIGNANAGLCG